MLFWDLKFPKTPQNRIGMLFWGMTKQRLTRDFKSSWKFYGPI
jgi:hypothetical protein